MNTVECLLEINKVDVEGCVPLEALLDNVAQGKGLVDASSSFAEPCLFLSEFVIDSSVNPFEKYSSEVFSGDGKEGYTSPVVTLAEVSFFWQFDDEAFSPVLWYNILQKRTVSSLVVNISFK